MRCLDEWEQFKTQYLSISNVSSRRFIFQKISPQRQHCQVKLRLSSRMLICCDRATIFSHDRGCKWASSVLIGLGTSSRRCLWLSLIIQSLSYIYSLWMLLFLVILLVLLSFWMEHCMHFNDTKHQNSAHTCSLMQPSHSLDVEVVVFALFVWKRNRMGTC